MSRIARALALAVGAIALLLSSATPALAATYDFVGDCNGHALDHESTGWDYDQYSYTFAPTIVITSSDTVVAPVFFAFECQVRVNGTMTIFNHNFWAFGAAAGFAGDAPYYTFWANPPDVVEMCTSVKYDTGGPRPHFGDYDVTRCRPMPLPR